MNILLVIGLVILLGTIGGRIFKRLNMPQVMGYIIIGLLLGESFRGFLSGPIMDSFRPPHKPGPGDYRFHDRLGTSF
ncbi:MAG: hypothetical protein ABID83_06205 [Candidatus Omnitrophota bacterium]